MERIGRIGSILLFVGLAIFGGPTTNAVAVQNQFSLKECVDLALQRNVGVISADNRYKQSKYNLLDAWGDVLPTVSTSARYSYGRSFGKYYVPEYGIYVEDPGTKSYSTGLSVSMTLFDGGLTWFSIKQSALERTSSRNELRQTIMNTAYSVKQAYYGLVQAVLLKKVQEDALARSKKQLEVTTSKYELGSASLSEKLKAQVNVARDSVTLLQRDNDIKNAEFNLNLLLNRDVTQPVLPIDTLGQVAFTLSLDQCVETALADNPSLKKSDADYSAARVAVWNARSSWVPRVSASLGWGWNSRTASDWFKYRYENGSYSFGVNLSYNIFDGFRKKTNYSRARLAEATQRESHDAARNNLVYQVRQAYLDIETARLQYQAAQLAEQSAQEDMKLQSERYRLGASSILELLDAQYSLTNAQYSRIQSLYQLNLAVASMSKAMGRM
jgi:outer membrane protein